MSTPGIGLDPRRDGKKLLVLCALGAVAFALGTIGYARTHSVGDSLYHALQLFVLHGHLEHDTPWPLHVARFLAPAATLLGVVRLVLPLFDEHLRRLYAWTMMRRHVVLLGSGSLAARLAEDFHRQRRRVIWLTDGHEPPAVWRRGVVSFAGDLESDAFLARARVNAGERIVIAGLEDESNLSLMARLEVLLEKSAPRDPIPCRVHVHDLELQRLFQRRAAEKGHARLRPSLFNVYEIQARRLLDEFPLDRVRIAKDSQTVVRLLVVGFGRGGQSVLLQAARVGHFANGKRLEITVLDLEAGAAQRRFEHRYPGLAEVVTTEFVSVDAADPALHREVLARVSKPNTLATVVLCLPRDSANAALALDLGTTLADVAPRPSILVRVVGQEGLRRILQAGDGLITFGAPETACTSADLVDGGVDRQARTIHEDYLRTRQLEGRDMSSASARPWEDLREDLKSSNRYQADHIAVKLRALGCSIVEPSAVLRPCEGIADAGQVETLAIMEHERWRAERYLFGWRLNTKLVEADSARRESPHLVPWERLAPNVKEWDRNAVRNIPRLVELTGRKITG